MQQIAKKAVLENMNECIEFVLHNLAGDIEADKEQINAIRLMCEEILMNIISYAYNDRQIGNMSVEYEFDKDCGLMTLIFSDHGIEFNPLETKDPDITLDIMDRDIGGLGIFLVKQIANEVFYERRDSANILTVKKKWR